MMMMMMMMVMQQNYWYILGSFWGSGQGLRFVALCPTVLDYFNTRRTKLQPRIHTV